MYQLVYVSSVSPGMGDALDDILSVSRRNNDRDGITGLLYFDGRRFLQALEGEEEAVERTYARIKRDPRHRADVVLSRRAIERREFGLWAMAHRTPGEAGGDAVARMTRLLADASPAVRGTFEGLAKVARTA